jgi:hypothetical protein
MIECSGVCYYNTAEAVTGRLCETAKARLSSSDSAQILFWDGKDELSDTLLSSAVGVVFPSDLPSSAIDKASRLARTCHLPALGVSLSAGIPKNGIAILDASLSKLFVDPDLDTINAYFGAHKRERKRWRRMLETTDIVSLSGTPYCGVVARLRRDSNEQKHYELLCEIADANTGAELVACADSADPDSFSDEVRAIYRAGVWGRFSLLITARTPDELDNRVYLMHKAFSMLQAERREFNGFIPKGLLVDTPLVLLSSPRTDALDFFCFDFEKLRRLLASSLTPSVGENDTIRYIVDFVKRVPNARISLRGLEYASEQALAELMDIERVYWVYEKQR